MTNRTYKVGRSVAGRSIHAYLHVSSPSTVLLLGGVHGDEPKGVYVARRFLEDVLGAALRPVSWVVIPAVNPDGLSLGNRRNAHKVDINRNFPTPNWAPSLPRSRMYGGPRPASEPETRAVMQAVKRWSPVAIITIHSIDADRFCVNYDGPARSLALAISRRNHYPVTNSIGYPTPGSFRSWAGSHHNLPVITLELPSRTSRERCWHDNREALLIVEQFVLAR